MNSINKHLLYKKMVVADQSLYDIKKEVLGPNVINIKWTFIDGRQMYRVSAYKVSFSKSDHAYTVNVFRNNKNVALFTGQDKARKLIERAMYIMGVQSR